MSKCSLESSLPTAKVDGLGLKGRNWQFGEVGEAPGLVAGTPGLRFWLFCLLANLFNSLVSVFPSVKGLNELTMYKCFVAIQKGSGRIVCCVSYFYYFIIIIVSIMFLRDIRPF